MYLRPVWSYHHKRSCSIRVVPEALGRVFVYGGFSFKILSRKNFPKVSSPILSTTVLTNEGTFFSGDFLENRTHPSVATLVDDAGALRSSFERVKKLDIRTVYPGHGKAFAMDEIG